jgi:hypothetical protein
MDDSCAPSSETVHSNDVLRVPSFLSLSETVTAQVGLDPSIAFRHLSRLSEVFETSLLESLLAVHDLFPVQDREQRLRDLLAESDKFALLVEAILVLWYTGGLLKAGRLDFPEGDPEPHFGALLWSSLGAHTPGSPGGYFGHWRYSPDNL